MAKGLVELDLVKSVKTNSTTPLVRKENKEGRSGKQGRKRTLYAEDGVLK